jgi:hypothetical protein
VKGRCFWLLKIPQDTSWIWMKTLNLRDIAKNLLKFKVGDGKRIFLSLDLWHPDGILYDLYGYRVIYDAKSKMDAKLSSVIRDQYWFW